MLRLSLTLLPQGDHHAPRDLGVLEIANIGGTPELGDYAITLRGPTHADATLRGIPRELDRWPLVRAAVAALFPVEHLEPAAPPSSITRLKATPVNLLTPAEQEELFLTIEKELLGELGAARALCASEGHPPSLLDHEEGDTRCGRCGALLREGGALARSGIYIASKAKHGPRWQALRAEGTPVISTWIDESGEGETSDWPGLWDRCIEEVSSAAMVIVYVEPGEVHKGALVEVGVALRAGVPVAWVGPEYSTAPRHRLVRMVDTLDEALTLFRQLPAPAPGVLRERLPLLREAFEAGGAPRRGVVWITQPFAMQWKLFAAVLDGKPISLDGLPGRWVIRRIARLDMQDIAVEAVPGEAS